MDTRGELKEEIKKVKERFLKNTKDKTVQIISHFDTDGITSAAIIVQALKKLDKKFSLQIVKSLTSEFIQKLEKDSPVLFLDLASGSIESIKNSGIKEAYIIDHHELPLGEETRIPDNIEIINPQLHKKEKLSGSGLAYLFSKEIDERNKEDAKLGILGLIGDSMEKDMDKIANEILKDSEVQKKRGPLIYPSTRPLNRTLEYCSSFFIPGVTGDIKGVLEMLREIGLTPENGKYKSLIELKENEMQNLITSILLRNPGVKNEEIVGDIFLIKFFNKLEDARELSAKINACSRSGEPEVAVQLCLEVTSAKKRAEKIHAKYKQEIVSGLKQAQEQDKIQGKNYVIINAQEKIKDTMAGTIASILSNSKIYSQGTIIITMAHDTQDKTKTKISARNVKSFSNGPENKNLRETLGEVVENLKESEVGGHQHAAGAIIKREDEEKFINNIKEKLDIETVNVKRKVEIPPKEKQKTSE
ncbi:MAG TPA: DHH family phosphoesterase [Candidatus Nanoarchaeia archaeon]|nr:DHH family phosphoesterase [Candidatus Nanoarchaeia archaeon]